LRSALLVASVFAAVALGSFFYGRMVRLAPAVETATAERPAPPVVDPAQLHAGIRDGLRAVQENRPADARTSFESVPATDPGYMIARGHLVSLFVGSRDYAAAAQVLAELDRLKPDDPAIAEQLAWAHYHLGRPADAELHALRSLEIDGQQSRVRYAVGLFRVADGRTAEAVPAYKRAMASDTGRRHVTDALGQLLALGKERPDLAGVHYLLAFFANALGQTALEIEELERFLAQAPEGPVANTARTALDTARHKASAPPTPGS
jgi:tetratricopeptide (TPR) repeat protein